MKTLNEWLSEPTKLIGAERACPGCGALLDDNEPCTLCAAINRCEALLAERKGVGRFIVASLPPESER
jgi:hypothetical protein